MLYQSLQIEPRQQGLRNEECYNKGYERQIMSYILLCQMVEVLLLQATESELRVDVSVHYMQSYIKHT